MVKLAKGSPAPKSQASFRDPQPLAKLIAMLSAVQMTLAAVNVISLLLRFKLLLDMKNRTYTGGFESSSLRIEILGLIWVALLVINAVFILKWIYRSAKNAIALDFRPMKTKPIWAIGWFFIPGANFFMPYRAMKEIWRASQRPAVRAAPASIVGWWWGLLVLFFVLDQLALWLGRNAQTGTEILLSTGLAALQAALTIPLNLVFIRLMHNILEMQNDGIAWLSKRK